MHSASDCKVCSKLSEHDQYILQLRADAVGKREMDIDLAVPIKVDGAERARLTMRRPRVGDIMEMQKRKMSDAEQELWLVARLTKVSPKDLDEVDAADWDALTAVLLGFRGGRLAT